jgi:hypothetical protein
MEARLFAAIPNGIGDNLMSLTAEGDPNPGAVLLLRTLYSGFLADNGYVHNLYVNITT